VLRLTEYSSCHAWYKIQGIVMDNVTQHFKNMASSITCTAYVLNSHLCPSARKTTANFLNADIFVIL
jgi:hypothetical protein